ncbi:Calmodulin-binding domain [Theobroma cacao]|nr:Calmodulin-binding domain [Theobroma cacao]
MVQRKVPNKLGIQADHTKPEKRLGSLKPSSCQHQDGKNKGTDLKKKMKKSRSIKLSDIEGLRSSPVRKTIAQPGKPPPLNVPAAAAATPQKKSVIKAVDGSPNYMKSTSSSEAKKEVSQVSSRNTQTGSDSKNLRRRSSTGSKSSSGSCNKPARTLTRTSSLKMVRTLTKSPSFKPVRASSKKCSRVALCADMDMQRATCSSTLKDSKFPAYLILNPGGTESEGTSIIKVCPYTYCSLNGHHHIPLPPLKCFLKARRRSMKTQRSMKMEALSPRRLKPSADGTEEFNAAQVVFGNDPASNGVDLDNSPRSPLMQEGGMDFFIEIYAISKGNDAEADVGSTQMNAKRMDDSGCGNETAPEHNTEKPVSESLYEGSPHAEIDFDENLERCSETFSEVNTKETLYEELKHDDVDEDFRGILVKEKSLPWNFNDGDEQKCLATIDIDHTMFEVIDMEWEECQFSASEPDDEALCSMETDYKSDPNTGDSSERDRNNLHDEHVISLDEKDSNITEEILADGAEQQDFEEDTARIDTCSQVSETLCYDQVSSAEEMFEVLVTMEEEEKKENAEVDLTGIVATPSATEELHEGGKEKILENGFPGTVNEVSEADPRLEVPENSCTIDVKEEALESTEQFQLRSFDKLEQDEASEDYNVTQETGDSEANQTVTVSDFSPEKELPSGEAGDGMEAGKIADAELLIGIQISDSSHVLSGADEDDEEIGDIQNNQLCEVNNAIDESFSTQDTVDESLFAESQDHPSDSQHENTNVVDSKSILEEDQDEAKFKVPTSMDSEEQNSSRMHKTSLAEGSEVGKTDLDSASTGLEAETFPTTSDKNGHNPRNRFSFTRSNAKEEVPDNHNNRKWTVGRKRHEENYAESRKFNPREPNFLPVVPEPDAEKVDLRHQMMDERKNAEEWMLDHALQQAVTKLAPARKRKVALLVEAFETVLPITKCESRLRHTSTGFGHGRPIQACN